MLSTIEKFCDILEKLVTKLDSIGFNKVLLYTFYLLVLVGLFNWESILTKGYEVINNYKNQQIIESIRTRESISKDIDVILQKLRLDCNADRVMLLEYHNTVQGLSGHHFKFFSATSEDIRDGVAPIGQRYQSINTGLMPKFLADLDHDNCITIMNPESSHDYPVIRQMMIQEDIGCGYYSVLQGENYPLGFITIQWQRREDGSYPDHDRVHSYIQAASLRITALLNKITL